MNDLDRLSSNVQAAAPLRGRRRAPAEDAAGRAAHAGRAGAARRQSRGNAIQPAPVGHRIERATRLVNQLLLLAREPRRHRPGPHRPERHRLRAGHALVPHALSLSTDLGFEGAETPVEINGNPLLAELLNNLVDNALDTRAAAYHGAGADWASKACLRSRTRAPASRRKNANASSTALPRAGTLSDRLGLAIVREIAQTHRPRSSSATIQAPIPICRAPASAVSAVRGTDRPPTPARCADMPAHPFQWPRRLCRKPKQRDAHAFGSWRYP